MQRSLERLSNHRVAVIGDVMLDSYLAGDVDRISPEAPVPVLQVANEWSVPGGAANVAANLASLGVHVELVGIAGRDEAYSELVNALQKRGVHRSGIVTVANHRTTRKLRIIGSRQQIARVDYEHPTSEKSAWENDLIESALKATDAADVVVISDYGKGACTDRVLKSVITHAIAAHKKIVVDPRRSDFSAYRGATILTPNRRELSNATQMACETDEEAAAAATKAQEACGAHILLTRSEKGMSLFSANDSPIHLNTVAQRVFDVSGAGDTVVAVIAAALAADLPFIEAMRIANHAAGIVVSKVGTSCVTLSELEASLPSDVLGDFNDGRLIDINQAAALRQAWARDKLTVGVANGCFDLIHPGHVALIRQAARNCDRLIIALNADSSVRRLKGPSRPIQDQLARADVVGALKGVAAVVLFEEDTPLEIITILQPDVLIKGADYREEEVVGADIVRGRGGRVVLATLVKGHSTTRLAGTKSSATLPLESV